MQAAIVIPARYASTRFPGKPLAMLAGKPMIQWVWEGARASTLATRVIVATDDPRIRDAAKGFGAEVAMTDPNHPTGTDRLAEVARGIQADVFVNVQGDEPLIRGAVIDAVLAPFADPAVEMASACRAPVAGDDLASPDVVKVVCDLRGDALYFSRSPVPHNRDGGEPVARPAIHIGLYAYRRAFLLRYAGLAPTPLEQTEKLEQLRALEHGVRIRMVAVEYESIGVDRPADLARAEARIKALTR
jgi:3-deoxy-manno-octulosonate cytidylyltransferase (CMP-KDO synthetase)